MLTDLSIAGQMVYMPLIVIPGAMVLQVGDDQQVLVPRHELDMAGDQVVDSERLLLQTAPEMRSDSPPSLTVGGVVF